MKNSNVAIAMRREEIEEYINENLEATVLELCQNFKVSQPTMRRDLILLDEMGKITRTHGGARKIANSAEYGDLPDQIYTIQQRIAQEAATQIKDGDTIFLNSSSTVLEVVKFIGDKRVNVITNNVRCAHTDFHPNTTIILTGGEIRYPKETLINDFALNTIQSIFADIAILGCSGYTPEDGMTTEVLQEAKINSLMIERSKKSVLVCDYRKIGLTSNFVSSKANDIDVLITDSFSDIQQITEIENLGTLVITVQ